MEGERERRSGIGSCGDGKESMKRDRARWGVIVSGVCGIGVVESDCKRWGE